KTAYEMAAIAESIVSRSGRLLATRASREQFEEVKARVTAAEYNERSRTIYCLPEAGRIPEHIRSATVAVIAAGTSDQPVAEEAAITLEVGGIGKVERIYDVGVSGIHRLIERTKDFG